MSAVEAHVETQTVLGQFVAHAIGRSPADILTQIAGAEEEELPADARNQIETGCPHQTVQWAIGTRRVDEKAADLGKAETHADVSEDEHGQQCNTRLVWT